MRASGTSNAIDELHDLAILGCSINLRKEMQELVDAYLKYMGKDVLVIPIDDIDLSMKHAYLMCEEIRKYLDLANCIVTICVKLPQLSDAIAGTFNQETKGDLSDEEIHAMTRKYISKLLPVSNRIEMPKAHDFMDAEIEIYRDGEMIEKKENFKLGILELIFNRTRYLFYHPAGAISPIVPNNLRDLFNLMSLLSEMPPVDDSRSEEGVAELQVNKRRFKHYFYSIWKNRFAPNIRKALDSLINFDFGTSLNRQVVSILTLDYSHYNDLQKNTYNPTEKDYRAEDEAGSSSAEKETNPEMAQSELAKGIQSEENFGYNVTIGDVFYLFSILEKETMPEKDYDLVFFLKSFYSIKLYEAYEHITENEGEIYPKVQPGAKGLTVIDHRLDHTNKLQQLIGGSYFSYNAGELLPSEVDLKIVKGKPINALLSEVKNKIMEMYSLSQKENFTASEKKELERFKLKMNIAEFLMLTIKSAVRRRRKEDKDKSEVEVINDMRKNVVPFHYRSFYPTTGYYMIDVMAPFANIVNIEFAYRRFAVMDDDFFRTLLNFKGSLINQMMDAACNERIHIKYQADVQRERLHRLMSDAVIRNAEVLTAVKENIIAEYRFKQAKKELMLADFYSAIQRSEMSTHKINSHPNSKPYLITFHFLKPLDQLMKKLLNPDKTLPADELQLYTEGATIFKECFGLLPTSKEDKPKKEKPIPDFLKIRKEIGNTFAKRGLKSKFKKASKDVIPEDLLPILLEGLKNQPDHLERDEIDFIIREGILQYVQKYVPEFLTDLANSYIADLDSNQDSPNHNTNQQSDEPAPQADVEDGSQDQDAISSEPTPLLNPVEE